ncbi:hypothetical protein HK414_02910 [Ramlibacter terrae]|uniref:Secreted protein n=1 Tax=Ramlibacter terrae TaxID=2732511 RepID=A0ABX6P2X5_9BURK|nr:hypothetical protein HK414_02910 [Ramlibacter terrae]
MPWKLAAGVYSTVPAAASTIVTVPWAPLVTEVMVGVPAKSSSPSTSLVTDPSSATVTALSSTSATGVTVRPITRVDVLPSSSVTVTVKLSGPL